MFKTHVFCLKSLLSLESFFSLKWFLALNRVSSKFRTPKMLFSLTTFFIKIIILEPKTNPSIIEWISINGFTKYSRLTIQNIWIESTNFPLYFLSVILIQAPFH